eukprot:scaffold81_cov147-Skeletonema_menzelii.AAC.1
MTDTDAPGWMKQREPSKKNVHESFGNPFPLVIAVLACSWMRACLFSPCVRVGHNTIDKRIPSKLSSCCRCVAVTGVANVGTN